MFNTKLDLTSKNAKTHYVKLRQVMAAFTDPNPDPKSTPETRPTSEVFQVFETELKAFITGLYEGKRPPSSSARLTIGTIYNKLHPTTGARKRTRAPQAPTTEEIANDESPPSRQRRRVDSSEAHTRLGMQVQP